MSLNISIKHEKKLLTRGINKIFIHRPRDRGGRERGERERERGGGDRQTENPDGFALI